MVSVAPLGDTFLGKGMKTIPPMASWAPADVFRFFFSAFTSGTIWIGIGLLLTFFVMRTFLVLSWADYSYVLPASSISSLVDCIHWHILCCMRRSGPIRWVGVSLDLRAVYLSWVRRIPARRSQERSSC